MYLAVGYGFETVVIFAAVNVNLKQGPEHCQHASHSKKISAAWMEKTML